MDSRHRRNFLKLAAAGTIVGLGSAPFTARGAADSERKLKIGIVGSGRIGGTLGGLWTKTGHEVMFSSRDLEHDKALAATLGPLARAGTPRDAAAFGEVLLVAVPYSALQQIGKDLGELL